MRKRKSKERVLLNNIKIERLAAEGNGLAKVEGKVLFVPSGVPGDLLDVVLTKQRKGYMQGEIVRIVQKSPLRVSPICPHSEVCGGCTWQILPYETQLQLKQQQVVDQLTRIGHLELPAISPIIGSERTECYRNKLEFTFSDRRWITKEELQALNNKLLLGASNTDFRVDSSELPKAVAEEIVEQLPASERVALGFHIPGKFNKVTDITNCRLQREPSNAIRNFVKEYAVANDLKFFDLYRHHGFLRNLIIRTSSSGEAMVIVVFGTNEVGGTPDINELKQGKKLLEAIKEKFPEISSLYYIVNNKSNDSIADLPAIHHMGSEYISEYMEDICFRIGPKSFYQTNSEQAYRLYSVVRECASLRGDEILYDLYTGAGTIALFLSKGVKKVIGIEYVEEAVADAKYNATANGITNAQFFAGDMRDILNQQFIEALGAPNVIVLDPPRAGIHPHVARVITEVAPERIVYVSCNPATQARDLAIFSTLYNIERVQPVDMFPHTRHVENVVSLIRKK